MDDRRWLPGQTFTMPAAAMPHKVWRVRRVKGRTIWYLANRYGCNPPRGILQKATTEEAALWLPEPAST